MNGTTLYTDGTADFTHTSNNVLGHLTAWLGLIDGDTLYGPDGRWYEITITDDTHITIAPAYIGGTITGSTYTIFKNSAARDSVRTASKQLSEISSAYRTILNLTGNSDVLILNKSQATDDAGVRLRQNGVDKGQFGIFGDDEPAIQYLFNGGWKKAISIDPATGAAKLSSGIVLSGILAPPQITADVNDYAPDGFAQCSYLRLDEDNQHHITGLAGGTQGRVVAIVNGGAHQLILDSQNVGSIDINRFSLETDSIILGYNQAALFLYDTDNRWKVISTSGAGTGTGGDKGWSPVFVVVNDGDRRVLQLASWVGGTGTAPTSVGQYVSTTGLVTNIALANDISGGARYDLTCYDVGMPMSGEVIDKAFPLGVTFKATLPQSQAGADVAATALATYSIRSNGVEFAQMKFAAGQAIGTFTCTTDITFAQGDVLTIIAPSPRDATLSGVAFTIIGRRF